ncbi:MAG TPA: hypothetical protein VHA34_10490 [Actinomycetes bacterium]|nr:hypothetical protein [Actinomycetes bacterium]
MRGFEPADLIIYLSFLAWVAVGAVIVARRPGNSVGWVLCAAGSLVLLSAAAAEYAVSAELGGTGLPAGRALAWLGAWPAVLGFGLFFYLLVLFPDGRLPSHRWRWAARLYTAGLAVGTASIALRPGAFRPGLRDLGPIQNPLGVPALAPLLEVTNAAARLIVVVLYLAATGSLLVRLRRSRGVERQQLKWVAYAGVLLIGSFLLVSLLEGQGVPAPVQLALDISFFVLGVLGVPTAVAVAVLRYRLYDIDRLINQTLVYGLLTALLGLGYAGVVLALGRLSGDVVGDPPSWAVAAATLAVAALFQPARRRVQRGVDRLFNRHRYDATRTIEAFSARLRNQVDLGTLSEELLAVVDETMRPATASLWLRPDIREHPRA